jgi:heme oxygenase (biliverdin-producing, ferredoxin)
MASSNFLTVRRETPTLWRQGVVKTRVAGVEERTREMSEIVARVQEKKEQIRAKLQSELAEKPFAALLRRDTWADHDRAQFSPFEMSLAEGTISKEGYRQLIANVYPVYVAMEERLESLGDDLIVGQFHIPELARAEFIAQDLEYFYGADWRNAIADEQLPGTADYIERVKTVDNVGFVAHHYTRYMADLSGGLMIAAALERAWGGKDGLAYYDFSSIGDAVGFKNAYRQALNELPLDVDGKIDLIGEVMVAYEFNIEMGKALAALHLEAEAVRA